MKHYVFLPHMAEVPQWKQCYYDWKTLHEMLIFLRKCLKKNRQLIEKAASKSINKIIITPRSTSNYEFFQTSQNLQPRIQSYYGLTLTPTKSKIQSSQKRISSATKLYTYMPSCKSHTTIIVSPQQEVKDIINQWIAMFTKYSQMQTEICYNFVQLKTFQIIDKFKQYQQFFKKIKYFKQQNQNTLFLVENLQIQSYYLLKAISFNLQKQKQMYHQIKSILKDKQYEQQIWHLQPKSRMKKLQIKNKEVFFAMQVCRSTYHHVSGESSYRDFKRISKQQMRMTYNQILLIGVVMGAVFLLIGALIISSQQYDITIYSNKDFSDHFPVWRGGSYLIMYMWILGTSVLFYQKAKINYSLIFQFQQHEMPDSKFIFLRASLFSLIYFGLFVLFFLQLSQQISTNFTYYGQLFWALIIGYVFLPIPIQSQKGRILFYKLLWKVIKTPCIPMSFLIIWTTEQLASLNQPFQDLYYTICYTIRKDAKWCKGSSPNFGTAYIMIIFAYRIIQSFKMFHQITMAKPDKKYDFMAGPFIGGIRACMSFVSALIALFLRINLFQNVFILWIVFISLTTFYSWLVDLKGDWGLLDYRQKKILREKILFPKAKPAYYIFAALDLILRAAWVLNISPFVVNSSGFQSALFVMMIAYLQIVRRGVWNILRIQFEHVRNCKQFQATMKDDHIFQSVKSKVVSLDKAKQKYLQKIEWTFINLGIEEDEKIRRKKQQQFALDQKLALHRKNRQLQYFRSCLKQRKKFQKQMKQLKGDLKQRFKALKILISQQDSQQQQQYFNKQKQQIITNN